MQPLGVDAHVHADDLVVAGAGFGVDLAGEEGGAVGGDVPAVLEEQPLQVVHLLTDSFTGAQSLQVRGGVRGRGVAESRVTRSRSTL